MPTDSDGLASSGRLLRLGVGGTRSIRAFVFYLIALVVLCVARHVSLTLGKIKSEAKHARSSSKGVMPMVRNVGSEVLETTWAIGVSTLAGLLLLT